ncbi:Dirigent protein [Melia azedarach]|uniref:Dirigent protein n=1 Tax=Melia azedarach TaxID=155640 RepID=A0ACC1Y945_MELAZ|nr:Dirigent protein [Melia azedarach]
MAKTFAFTSKATKATICLLFLAITLRCANSARILDEVDPQPPVIADLPESSNPASTTVVPPATTFPSGQFSATTPAATPDDDSDVPTEAEAPVVVAPPVDDDADAAAPVDDVAPFPSPTPTLSSPVAAASATVAQEGPDTPPKLSFFMHDVLGGSHPTARVVTGIIARTEINGIPFSKANDNFFPVIGGTPLLTSNNLNNIVNPNNVPFLTGLNGAQASTVLQNAGTSNLVEGGGNQPFVTAGQLPGGASLQKLMFGTVTVIDDELTEGHELGSGIIGKAQGFYLASSLDGTSQTLALTALLHGGEHEHDIQDTISFFGVHRTASHDSHIAVIGGTGKYEHAKGYATVETIHQEDQHTTDGVDTIVKFSVYLTDDE